MTKNKTQLCLILMFLATLGMSGPSGASQTAEFSLTVKPLRGSDGKVSMLDVQEELRGGLPSDGSPLRLRAAMSTFGVKSIANKVEHLEVSDSSGFVGMIVSDDLPSGAPNATYRHWQASRAVILPVVIRYQITTQSIDEQGGPPFGMKAAGAGVAGNGRGFLLLPENAATTSTSMHWDLTDLPTEAVGVITAGKGDVVVAGPPDEMLEQWMLAGPSSTFNSKISPKFHVYALGAAPFDVVQMQDWADRSYAYLSESLKYLGAPEYNLFIRALDGPSFGTGTAKPGGGGSMINVGSTYYKNQNLDYIHNVAFHEMTHQWVGEFDSDAPWFSEGLTTYLTAVLPCRSGIELPSFCAASINSSTHTYYESDARNWSLSKIRAGAASENVRRAPYGRGMLYFAQLDSEVRKKSGGVRGLEELLYPLFLARQKGARLNNAAWETMLERELGPQAVADFRRMIVEGEVTLIPPSDAFGPCLTRVNTSWAADGEKKIIDGYEWQPVECEKHQDSTVK